MSQHTEGAKHYGITTEGAKSHIREMLESPDWGELTKFDLACIAELLADNSHRSAELLRQSHQCFAHRDATGRCMVCGTV